MVKFLSGSDAQPFVGAICIRSAVGGNALFRASWVTKCVARSLTVGQAVCTTILAARLNQAIVLRGRCFGVVANASSAFGG